jgi:hypothetical protein
MVHEALSATETVISKCVLSWAYKQTSVYLRIIRDFIEKMILKVDQQILVLRAFIASRDPVLLFEKYTWNKYEEAVDAAKNILLSGITKLGPAQDVCPEFYEYLTSPAIALLEAGFSFSEIYKNRYSSLLSFTAHLNTLLRYWETTKEQLRLTLDIIDDALYNALVVESDDLLRDRNV